MHLARYWFIFVMLVLCSVWENAKTQPSAMDPDNNANTETAKPERLEPKQSSLEKVVIDILNATILATLLYASLRIAVRLLSMLTHMVSSVCKGLMQGLVMIVGMGSHNSIAAPSNGIRPPIVRALPSPAQSKKQKIANRQKWWINDSHRPRMLF